MPQVTKQFSPKEQAEHNKKRAALARKNALNEMQATQQKFAESHFVENVEPDNRNLKLKEMQAELKVMRSQLKQLENEYQKKNKLEKEVSKKQAAFSDLLEDHLRDIVNEAPFKTMLNKYDADDYIRYYLIETIVAPIVIMLEYYGYGAVLIFIERLLGLLESTENANHSVQKTSEEILKTIASPTQMINTLISFSRNNNNNNDDDDDNGYVENRSYGNLHVSLINVVNICRDNYSLSNIGALRTSTFLTDKIRQMKLRDDIVRFNKFYLLRMNKALVEIGESAAFDIEGEKKRYLVGERRTPYETSFERMIDREKQILADMKRARDDIDSTWRAIMQNLSDAIAPLNRLNNASAEENAKLLKIAERWLDKAIAMVTLKDYEAHDFTLSDYMDKKLDVLKRFLPEKVGRLQSFLNNSKLFANLRKSGFVLSRSEAMSLSKSTRDYFHRLDDYDCKQINIKYVQKVKPITYAMLNNWQEFQSLLSKNPLAVNEINKLRSWSEPQLRLYLEYKATPYADAWVALTFSQEVAIFDALRNQENPQTFTTLLRSQSALVALVKATSLDDVCAEIKKYNHVGFKRYLNFVVAKDGRVSLDRVELIKNCKNDAEYDYLFGLPVEAITHIIAQGKAFVGDKKDFYRFILDFMVQPELLSSAFPFKKYLPFFQRSEVCNHSAFTYLSTRMLHIACIIANMNDQEGLAKELERFSVDEVPKYLDYLAAHREALALHFNFVRSCVDSNQYLYLFSLPTALQKTLAEIYEQYEMTGVTNHGVFKSRTANFTKLHEVILSSRPTAAALTMIFDDDGKACHENQYMTYKNQLQMLDVNRQALPFMRRVLLARKAPATHELISLFKNNELEDAHTAKFVDFTFIKAATLDELRQVAERWKASHERGIADVWDKRFYK